MRSNRSRTSRKRGTSTRKGEAKRVARQTSAESPAPRKTLVQPMEATPSLRWLGDRIVEDWTRFVPQVERTDTYQTWDKCQSSLDPPMVLENTVYCSPTFRKMHVEYAEIGDEFRVLHCVIAPHVVYPVPIFGADIVQRGNKTTFCITDLSPVTKDLMLPTEYLLPLENLKRNLIRTASLRMIPAWGRDIFSEACLCLSPKTNECVYRWFRYTLSAHRFYLDKAIRTPQKWNFQETHACHVNYANTQRKNDKTRAVLERHFGADFADHYIENVLFDVPPLEEPTEDGILEMMSLYYSQERGLDM